MAELRITGLTFVLVDRTRAFCWALARANAEADRRGWKSAFVSANIEDEDVKSITVSNDAGKQFFVIIRDDLLDSHGVIRDHI